MAATSVILFIAILIIAIYKFYPVAIVTQVQQKISFILIIIKTSVKGSAGLLSDSSLSRFHYRLCSEFLCRLDT